MRKCAILACFVFLGCGGSDDGGPPTINDVCGPNGIYVDYIGRFIECNPLFSLVVGNNLSDEDVAAACDAQLRPYVEDGTVLVGGTEAFAECREFINNAACEDVNDRHTTDPCGGVFEGTVGAGAPCENSEQCAGDSYCDQPTPPSCGTCAPRLADNATCSDDEECISRRCDVGMCQPFVGLNGTCQQTEDCLSPYICNGTSNLCVAAPTWSVNTPCNPTDILNQCGFPNLYCSQATSMCTAWKEVGQTCSTSPAAGMLCRLFEYQTCQDIGAGLQCQAATIVALGQDCGITDGRKCADGLICGDHDNDGGTPDQCFAPLPLNAACDTANSLCDFLLTCVNGTCQYENDYTGTCPVPPTP